MDAIERERRYEMKVTTVFVRWFDGYLEQFEATEIRFGSDLLWMRLLNGQNRHIPTKHVRWFSQNPESHETLDEKKVTR